MRLFRQKVILILCVLFYASGLLAEEWQRLDLDLGIDQAERVLNGDFSDRFGERVKSSEWVNSKSPLGSWWRLDLSILSQKRDLIVPVYYPTGAEITFFKNNSLPEYKSLFEPALMESMYSGKAIVFALPNERNGFVYLFLKNPSANKLQISIEEKKAYLKADATHLRHLNFAFGMLCAFILIALMGLVLLKDKSYVYFVGYIFTGLLYIVYVSGEGYRLPILSEVGFSIKRLATWVPASLSAIFTVLFMREFTQIKHNSTLIDKVLIGIVMLHLLSLMFGLSPFKWLQAHSPAIGNFAIVFGSLFTLVAMLWAWSQNNKKAGIFLLAWFPLLLASSITVWIIEFNVPIFNYPVLLAYGMVIASSLFTYSLASSALRLRRERDQAHGLANIDPLTGANNRRALEKRLKVVIEEAEESNHPVCAAFLDLDHFKKINDELGHGVGDECLKIMTETINQNIRMTDYFARYGGEEFILLLPKSNIQSALICAERIRVVFEQKIKATLNIDATVSIGLAELREEWTAEQLLQAADQALYQSKSNGRNQVSVYSERDVKL